MTAMADRMRDLEAIVGQDNLLTATEAVSRYRVDGQQPFGVASPATAEQVADVLELASAAGLSVLLRGAGKHMHLGALPGPIGLVLSLSRLNAIIDFDHENLTITAQAGATLAAIQQAAVQRRQMLPLDPPGGDDATIGGIAATNLAGPLRTRYGAPRDLVIGVRAALSDGTIIKAGGKTVKNVAGYELTKLFVGSLGTLAAFTEVTVRLAPLPEATSLLAASMPSERIAAVARDLLASRLEIASLTACDTLALARTGLTTSAASPDAWWLLVGLVGDKAAVERQQHDVRSAIGQGCTQLDGDGAARAWRGLREATYPAPSETILRASLPLSRTTEFMQAIGRLDGWWALGRLDQGAVFAGPSLGGRVEDAVGPLSALRDLAQSMGGLLVLAAAPAELKRSFAVWGANPNLDLMRKLKESYDPAGTLGCGRYLAGL